MAEVAELAGLAALADPDTDTDTDLTQECPDGVRLNSEDLKGTHVSQVRVQRRERNLSRVAGPNSTVLDPSRRRGHHESPWMYSCSEGCHSPLVAICNARVPVSVVESSHHRKRQQHGVGVKLRHDTLRAHVEHRQAKLN